MLTRIDKIKVNNKSNEETKKEKNISLLDALKQKHSVMRLGELEKLIKAEFKNYKLLFAELKAIVALLPKQDHFAALEHIKENFDIQLSYLEVKKLKIYLSVKDRDQPSFKKLLDSYAKLNFEKVLATISECSSNKRLQQIQGLTKQYQLIFSDREKLKNLLSSFPEKDLFELVKMPVIWKEITEINQKGRPPLPLNQVQTLKLLTKLNLYAFNTASEPKEGSKKRLNPISLRNKKQQASDFFKGQATNNANRFPDIILSHKVLELNKC